MSRIKSFFTPPQMAPANGTNNDEDLGTFLLNQFRKQGFILKLMLPFMALLGLLCFIARQF